MGKDVGGLSRPKRGVRAVVWSAPGRHSADKPPTPLTLRGLSGGVADLSPQVCRACLVSALDTGARENPSRRALGFTSSRCFRDLVWFLVSQKALFLGSCCCLQPRPVITGHQGGGLLPVSRAVPRSRVSPRVSLQRPGPAVGSPEHTQCLSTACTWIARLPQVEGLL